MSLHSHLGPRPPSMGIPPPWKQTKTAARARSYAGSPLRSRRRQAADDEDAADLDELAYTRLTPRGKSPTSACPSDQKEKIPLQTEHEVPVERDKLDARVPTPDLLVFPPFARQRGAQALATETKFGAFVSGVASVEDDFDGTPGGFLTFHDKAAEGVEEAEVRGEVEKGGGELGAGAARYLFRCSAGDSDAGSLDFRLGGWLGRWLDTQDLDKGALGGLAVPGY
ncbi:hypothetical protein DFH08DRAFT_826306 [Mycena albidolilacea]|uniref:Uncharacterized protein n=1 Tax=Mycena albidolilacea TaxID=1033008 RepID=A0AAD7E8H8_9AGAR|nr:hypothetical protein DFH08DRAFT_826306 [Mycena albidolilacea]